MKLYIKWMMPVLVPLPGDAKQMQQADSRNGNFKSWVPYFLAELKRTDVTKQLLWQEYKKDNADGYEYSQFCDLFKQYRKIHEATMPFEHKPADVVMADLQEIIQAM